MPSVYVDGVGSLVGESLAAGFDAAGYDVVRPTEGMSASELQSMVLSVDTTVMVAVPSADCGAADLMSLSCILAAFRHAVYPGTKRVVLVSTVATWGKLVAEPGVAVTEDHFRRRAPLAGSIELKALEDQLMLLSSSKLETCVVGAGVPYGKGEDILYPMFRDAWLRKDVTVPSNAGGANALPLVHTSELTDFVVDLAKPSNPIPKPYVLAVEAEPIPLAEIASTVSASVGTGGTVMMDADAFTDAVMDMPELALLQVDLPLSMGKSIFATFTKSSSRAGFVAAASGATKDEFLTSRGVGPSRVVLAGMHGALMDNVAGLVQAKYNVPLVALADGVAYLQEQGQAWEAKQEALTAATAAAEENSEDAEAAAALAAAQEAVAVVPGWLTLYEELKVATEPQGKAKEETPPSEEMSGKCLRELLLTEPYRTQGYLLTTPMNQALFTSIFIVQDPVAVAEAARVAAEKAAAAEAEAKAKAEAAAAAGEEPPADEAKVEDGEGAEGGAEEEEAAPIPLVVCASVGPDRIVVMDAPDEFLINAEKETGEEGAPADTAEFEAALSAYRAGTAEAWPLTEAEQAEAAAAQEANAAAAAAAAAEAEAAAEGEAKAEGDGDAAVEEAPAETAPAPAPVAEKSATSLGFERVLGRVGGGASPSNSLNGSERVLDVDVSVEGFSAEGLASECLGSLPGSLYLIAESNPDSPAAAMIAAASGETPGAGGDAGDVGADASASGEAVDESGGAAGGGGAAAEVVEEEKDDFATPESPPQPKFDGITDEEYSELEKRSQIFRAYLMSNVMPTLTHGMLEVIKSKPKDPIDFLSNYLIVQGKLVERKAEAAAFLQFQGMLAKLKAYNESEARAVNAGADEDSDED